MASRYPTIKVSNYCFHPRLVIREDGERLSVPCGKCDGCLLHRANSWAMRLGNEIESQGNAIFFTLTYDNKYLPKLYKEYFDIPYGRSWRWVSNHPDNIRFDGVKDVPRKDDIVIETPYPAQMIKNWYGDNICYSSKRDFQLYLKSVRKDLNEKFPNETNRQIRYFAVSEYGPTTHRAHIHAVLFAPTRELGEYLLQESLFNYWQMQDSWQFFQYAHFCDSGARGYLTQYLTSTADNLPVHQQKEIKPFRLSSKSPSIGFSQFDEKEVSEKVSIGVNTYTKEVSRLNERYVLEYPTNYLRTLFPKCFRYRFLSYDGLLSVYGFLVNLDRWFGTESGIKSFRIIRQAMHPMNYNAALKCFNYCKKHGVSYQYYVYLLDMNWYRHDMEVLRLWYSNLTSFWSVRQLLTQYDNFIDYYWKLRNGSLSRSQYIMLDWLCQSLHFTIEDLKQTNLNHSDFVVPTDENYKKEVEDIILTMVKSAKYNEYLGNAPTIV